MTRLRPAHQLAIIGQSCLVSANIVKNYCSAIKNAKKSKKRFFAGCTGSE
jgi:hypothetical protein